MDNYDGIMNIILPTLGKERQKTYCPFLPLCPETGHVLEIPLKKIDKVNSKIIFDNNGNIEQVAQEEYPLIFPNDGWVEIDPDDLYKSVTNTLNQLDLQNVTYGGITNQRETTIIWDKTTSSFL